MSEYKIEYYLPTMIEVHEIINGVTYPTFINVNKILTIKEVPLPNREGKCSVIRMTECTPIYVSDEIQFLINTINGK